MAKKKHKKKQPIVPCVDANERIRKSLAEKARKAAALQKKYEMLRGQYEAEMKRREEANKASQTGDTTGPEPETNEVTDENVDKNEEI